MNFKKFLKKKEEMRSKGISNSRRRTRRRRSNATNAMDFDMS